MGLIRLFTRRSMRRPMVIVLLLGFVVFLAGYLKDMAFKSLHPLRVEIKTMIEPVTVTRTRTAWARTTRTVFAEGTGPTAVPLVAQDPQNLDARHDSGPENPDADTDLPLGEHDYRFDGLLEVNPNGGHPIFELIANAEAAWKEKLSKASTTLDEAVTQYEHRYRRPPPLGFDDWWAYVEEHQVQLPDEYDQINLDLEPFWGMDPEDLQAIEREWEGHADSWTIGKDADSPISLLNFSLPGNDDARADLAGGAFQVMELLEEVEEFIPPFRAIFSPHDNPNLHTDFELKEMALEAAQSPLGQYIDINFPPEVKLHGWLSACDPLSRAWRDPIDWSSTPPPPKKKTFIYNHREAMDPCQHPSHLLLHGQFVSHHTGPVPHRKMIPQFSYCPTLLHHDIMAAMPVNWVEDIYPRSDDPPWEEKSDERLQWRGSNTGIWHDENTNWKNAQRARLVDWATNGYAENMTILKPPQHPKEKIGGGVQVKKGKYGPAMLDIAFAGKPLSCATGTCEQLATMFEYRKPHDNKAAGNYKYILDVDGNGWSSRFKRLITSNSLIFKSTIYPEWFTDRIAPWVHYVPVQIDLSDLYDSLLFFRGDLNGENAHDDLAKRIAYAGREWSLQFWRKEDLTAYMFRLFLEYARVMNPERDGMSYNHWGSPDFTNNS